MAGTARPDGLVGTEITGVWRARASGEHRLVVHVTQFESWPAETRAAIEEEAGRLATARGLRTAEVQDHAR